MCRFRRRRPPDEGIVHDRGRVGHPPASPMTFRRRVAGTRGRARRVTCPIRCLAPDRTRLLPCGTVRADRTLRARARCGWPRSQTAPDCTGPSRFRHQRDLLRDARWRIVDPQPASTGLSIHRHSGRNARDRRCGPLRAREPAARRGDHARGRRGLPAQGVELRLAPLHEPSHEQLAELQERFGLHELAVEDAQQRTSGRSWSSTTTSTTSCSARRAFDPRPARCCSARCTCSSRRAT